MSTTDQQEQLRLIQQQAEAIQGKVNTLSSAEASGLSIGSNTTVQDAERFLQAPVSSPTPVTQLSPSTPTLPPPTAAETHSEYMTSVQGSVDQARATVDTMLNSEKARVDARIEELKKEEAEILRNQQELSQPFREELENAERERLYINENFESNQKLINELEGLLMEGNEAIRIAKGRAVKNTVLNQSVYKTISAVEARAGVIQAVLSARSGQIAEAQRLIDRSINAITADRNDELSYYNTLLSLNNQGLLSLEGEQKQIALEKRNLAYMDLERAQKSADYIKELMINPQTAEFMAKAGVTLTDSIEEINEKMSAQSIKDFEEQYFRQSIDMLAQSGYATPDEISRIENIMDPKERMQEIRAIQAAATNYERQLAIRQQEAALASMYNDVYGDIGIPSEPSALAMMVLNNPSLLDTLTPTVRGEVLREIANAGGQFQTAGQESARSIAQQALDTLTLLQDNDRGRKAASGIPSVWNIIPGSQGREWSMRLDTLKAQLALPNLELLRGLGRMSQEQFRTLKEASESLNRKSLSNANMKKELERVEKILREYLRSTEFTGAPSVQWGGPQQAGIPGAVTEGSTMGDSFNDYLETINQTQ